jgi:Lipocalin-like domain
VAEDVDVTVAALELEIAVIRRQPPIEDLHDVDAAFVDNERARCLLTAMTGVTFHAERHVPIMKYAAVLLLLAIPQFARGQPIEGRWKLLAAEDLRADGTVARHPWGRNPVGSIVVDRGWCYVQIMSGDVPSFSRPGVAVGEQMSAMLLSSYIAYSGACTVDDREGSVSLKVDAAWRPNYVGTEQKRFFRFEGNNKMFFGPAPNSMKSEAGPLTRRLTLERQP